MNHSNNKRLCKRSQFNNNKSLKSKDQRLLSHLDLKILLISMVLLAKKPEPEVVKEVAAVDTEAVAVVPEVAEAKEEKVRKVLLAEVEVNIAVAEVAVVREDLVRMVILNQEVMALIDQEAAEEVAEAEVEDPKVKKALLLQLKVVMKEFSMFNTKKELITSAKMNTSRVRKMKNGTHMTEDQALEEAEK